MKIEIVTYDEVKEFYFGEVHHFCEKFISGDDSEIDAIKRFAERITLRTLERCKEQLSSNLTIFVQSV